MYFKRLDRIEFFLLRISLEFIKHLCAGHPKILKTERRRRRHRENSINQIKTKQKL